VSPLRILVVATRRPLNAHRYGRRHPARSDRGVVLQQRSAAFSRDAPEIGGFNGGMMAKVGLRSSYWIMIAPKKAIEVTLTDRSVALITEGLAFGFRIE
jgi:hypothetical protein